MGRPVSGRARGPGSQDALRVLRHMAAAASGQTPWEDGLEAVRRVLGAEGAVWLSRGGAVAEAAPPAVAGRAGEAAALAARALEVGEVIGAPAGTGGAFWEAAPAGAADRPAGVLLVAWAERRRRRVWERPFLEAAAGLLGACADRARAERRVERLAALEEGQRLAREMHDGIAQSLGYLKLKAEVALALADNPDAAAQLRATLEAIRRAAVEALGDVRRAISDLRAPASGSGPPFPERLRRYVEAWAPTAGVQAEVRLPEGPLALAPDAEFQVLRIVAEALANTARHAGARHVTVDLRQGRSGLVLAIRDDGHGFDPEAVGDGAHFGLQILRERGALLGGAVEVRSQPGGGTMVRLRMPAAGVRGAAAVPCGR